MKYLIIGLMMFVVSCVSNEIENTIKERTGKEYKEFMTQTMEAMIRLINKRCAAKSCEQFNGDIVATGKTANVDSYILKLSFVRVYPGGSSGNTCIYVHFTYDKYTGYYKQLIYPKDFRDNPTCSIDAKVSSRTFKDALISEFGYVGSLPK